MCAILGKTAIYVPTQFANSVIANEQYIDHERVLSTMDYMPNL